MSVSSSIRLAAVVFFILSADNKFIICNNRTSLWMDAGRMTGLLLHKCISNHNGSQETLLMILQRCLKRRTLRALDRSLASDVIEVATGIEFVRENRTNRSLSLFDSSTFQSNEKEPDWKTQVLQRIAHVLDTHVLKIRLNGHETAFQSEGRGRRKRQNMMMSLMMFGIVAVGMIMIPMGFQFLAVLGGKALLLAKMALILTSIQGLKKIATSNVNYGLYTTPEYQHQGHWHYDRQWPYDVEGHEAGASSPNYYDVPDQHTDVFHTLFHPRIETSKNKYLA